MFVAETDLIGYGYNRIGELANLALYKRELSKHVTSLAICLRDEDNRSNTKMLVIDSSFIELLTDAIANKQYKRLNELLGIANH